MMFRRSDCICFNIIRVFLTSVSFAMHKEKKIALRVQSMMMDANLFLILTNLGYHLENIRNKDDKTLPSCK